MPTPNRDRAAEVLAEFAAAADLGRNREREPWTDAGGVEALRAAYRERHRARGLCMWCTRPAARGRHGRLLTCCDVHRAAQAARALARYYARTGRAGEPA